MKVGPPNGMVVDPEWSVLEPHAEQLLADGFGFSAVTIDDGDLSELLSDWGGGNGQYPPPNHPTRPRDESAFGVTPTSALDPNTMLVTC